MTNVTDLFKNYGEVRAKESLGSDYFYNNRSVYSSNYTTTRIVNTNNIFSNIVKDEDVKELRLMNNEENVSQNFPKYNNMFEEFLYKNNKYAYKEIVRTEETTGEEYYILKAQGFTNFYKLYIINEFGIEKYLCTLAVKRG